MGDALKVPEEVLEHVKQFQAATSEVETKVVKRKELPLDEKHIEVR